MPSELPRLGTVIGSAREGRCGEPASPAWAPPKHGAAQRRAARQAA
ncbi:hypothetical protein [Paracidovorax anthurii]|uniref:Uncharacterized protein n=1 Tax=Paracidovorax anthurii TaxID=78229 RepID=A0A328YYE5_9BURK|nr:hypothetical protein [Paracidovorax anthurii]RAR77845.1 hypothetical protein AX018_103448 [Paracidovorax anthurii]